MKTPAFDYDEAFSRNIGWVTPQEQQILKFKRVAIAGLGGVGGNHLITLTRLGIGKFNISDFDSFDLPNFNRQFGASMATLEQFKIDVLREQAMQINPELQVGCFADGINEHNVDDFLEGVDLYLDSLDFFAIKARKLVFTKCAEKQIPAITAAPLGMGCAYLAFLPGQMSFEQYFRLEGHDENQQLLRFLVGLAPARLQNAYLVYPQAVDIANHKGPSTPLAIQLCAGIAGTEALKLLLNRGKTIAAPWGVQVDGFKNKIKKTWRPGGNNNPVQQLALMIARKKFGDTPPKKDDTDYQLTTKIKKIIDTARWAPSGDNTQPWRFEIINEEHLVIRGWDTRDHVVYDLQGHASQVSLGALLETLRIAATAFGMTTQVTQRADTPQGQYVFDVHFNSSEPVEPSVLLPYVQVRSVQRRPMRLRRLSEQQKEKLQSCLPEGYRVIWFEGIKQKWQVTKLLFRNAGLRLTLPEAYPVHRDAIEWHSKLSTDKMPIASLGIDPLTGKIMKWAMKSWDRLNLLNRYLGATIPPRLQMELIPGLACGAHFVILANNPALTDADHIEAGKTVQRFWLTATQLGLHLQPQYTPVVFSKYVHEQVNFSRAEHAKPKAEALYRELDQLLKGQAQQAVFMGRIGTSQPPKSRSVRHPLDTLISVAEHESGKS